MEGAQETGEVAGRGAAEPGDPAHLAVERDDAAVLVAHDQAVGSLLDRHRQGADTGGIEPTRTAGRGPEQRAQARRQGGEVLGAGREVVGCAGPQPAHRRLHVRLLGEDDDPRSARAPEQLVAPPVGHLLVHEHEGASAGFGQRAGGPAHPHLKTGVGGERGHQRIDTRGGAAEDADGPERGGRRWS